MAKKGTIKKITWYCREKKDGDKGCGKGNYHSKMNVNNEIKKRLSKFCKAERQHTWHQYKETRS